jgi:hypothetical protein
MGVITFSDCHPVNYSLIAGHKFKWTTKTYPLNSILHQTAPDQKPDIKLDPDFLLVAVDRRRYVAKCASGVPRFPLVGGGPSEDPAHTPATLKCRTVFS